VRSQLQEGVLSVEYRGSMTARKLSISVSTEVEETIRASAAEEGKPVSAWLAEAAVEKAQATAAHIAGRAAARELITQYEAEHGPLPDESRQRARQFMMDAGLPVIPTA
jgi:4'-phosphopantetheinyl transferase EntD